MKIFICIVKMLKQAPDRMNGSGSKKAILSIFVTDKNLEYDEEGGPQS